MLARLWREHRLLLLAFALAALLTVFFAVRTTVFWVHWSDPALRDVDIQGWMTPGYVAHSYQVAPEVIFGAIGPSDLQFRRVTLDDIAARTGRPLQAIVADIHVAVAEARGEVP